MCERETKWILIYAVHLVSECGMLIVREVVLLVLFLRSICNSKIGIERFVSRFVDGPGADWAPCTAADAGIMFDLSQIGKVFGNNEYHPSGIIMQADLWCW